MKILILNVTSDHIKRGVRGSSMSCPVALALKEKIKKGVSVQTNSIRIEGGRHYKSPKKVCEFIKKFDKQESVKPFKKLLILI